MVVRDLFGNLPVRVKQRAIRHNSHGDTIRDHETLKKNIVALLLAWSKPARVIVAEKAREKRYVLRNDKMCLRGRDASPLHDKTRSQSFQLSAISSLLAQADYIPHCDASAWLTASARTSSISIRAAICREAAPTKYAQFISLGMQPIISTASRNTLFDEVNHIFSLSSFGILEEVEETSQDGFGRGEEERRAFDRASFRRQAPSIAKGPDRWPVFYIRVETTSEDRIAGKEAAEADEGTRRMQKVSDLLRSLICQFLQEHHFQPRIGRRRRRKASGTSFWARTTEMSMAGSITGGMLLDFNESNDDSSCSDQLSKSFKPHILPQRSKSLAFQSWSRLKSGQKSSIKQVLAGLPGSKAKSGGTRSASEPTGVVGGAKSLIEVGRFAIGERTVQPIFDRDTQLLNDNLSDDDTSRDTGHCSVMPEHAVASSTATRESNEDATNGDSVPINPPVDQAVLWNNPTTGRDVWLNSRTGLVVPGQSLEPGPEGPFDSERDKSFIQRSRSRSFSTTEALMTRLPLITRRRAAHNPSAQPSSWLGKVLKDWSNPVFRQSEQPITSLADENALLPQLGGHSGCNGNSTSRLARSLEPLPNASVCTSRLSKNALTCAQVIGQVDQKFVLIRMARVANGDQAGGDITISPRLLVLVDQHAADERCRVEELYQQLGEVEPAVLPKPVQFDVTFKELELFVAHRAFFLSCGIVLACQATRDPTPFNGSSETSTSSTSGSTKVRTGQIVITALPALIAERCRLEPKLLIDMLRAEIWSRLERAARPDPVVGAATENRSSPPAWVSKITRFPRGIVDMLNSRACRGAIMFNDVLTHEECTALVRRLARCVFPFQCAHGRPTMVAVVGLGEGEGDGETGRRLLGMRDELGSGGSADDGGANDAEDSFATAFDHWQGMAEKASPCSLSW